MLNGREVFGLSEVERVHRAAVSFERLVRNLDVPLMSVDEREETGRDLVDSIAGDLAAGSPA